MSSSSRACGAPSLQAWVVCLGLGLAGILLMVGTIGLAALIVIGASSSLLTSAGQPGTACPGSADPDARTGDWDDMGRRDPDGKPPITGVLPATVAKAAEIVDAVTAQGFSITSVMAAPPSPSMWGTGEHGMGRAIDVMVDSIADGDAVASYAWTHRRRLGVKWIVWNHQIRSTSANHPGRWESYSGTANPHTDHNHIFFTDTPHTPPDRADIPADPGAAGPPQLPKSCPAAARRR